MTKRKTITHYTQLQSLRPVDPTVPVGIAQKIGTPLDDHLRSGSAGVDPNRVDWVKVAQSLQEAAETVERILAQIPPAAYVIRDHESKCRVCDDGDRCRDGFVSDIDDVIAELKDKHPEVIYTEVVCWMHENGYHWGNHGITELADTYVEVLERRRAAVILDRYRPVFFGR